MRDLMRRLSRRLLRILRPGRVDRQLEEELRFHIESETAAKEARGMSAADARRLTLAELGGVERWRDEVRDQRPTRALELLSRDVRLATRALLRAPAYSVPAIATLALGIAALATIVSLTSAVLLRPLPYDDPGRLVALWEKNVPRNRTRNVVSAAVFDAWRTRSRTLETVTAFMPSSLVWQTDGAPERVFGAEVSPNMFDLLGRRPMLGAGFSPGTPVNEVVISHALWTQRFSADSSLIGRQVRFGATSLTVVGVMPNDFVPVEFGWMTHQDYWLPLNITVGHNDWGRFLVVGGRLRPGITHDVLGKELTAISSQLIAEKALIAGWDAHALPLIDEMTGSVKPALIALAIAALLLLAMVMTNTALLTLAHLRQRAPDSALRAALGATGSRLRGERLVTSTLLAVIGAGTGAMLAIFAIPILVRVLPRDVPRLDSVHLDSVAAGSIATAMLLVALMLALLPSRGVFLTHELAAQSARLSRRSRATWLIVAEAALALVLAVLASLTVRSFDRLRSVDVGFEPASLLSFRVALEDESSTTPSSVVFDRLLERIRATPGVQAAGLTSVRPFGDGGAATTFGPLGSGEADRSTLPVADVRVVDPGFFETLGITPLSGRLFTGKEVRGTQMLAVVNDAMPRALWPGEPNAIGRKFSWRMYGDEPPEIIGVVRDVRLVNARLEPRPTVYLSAAQVPGRAFDLIVRSKLPESAILPSLRAAVQASAPGTPVFRIASLERAIAESMARERVTAILLGFFAIAALLLVAVGVYGLFAGEVARGRQEIGVRMALGESAMRLVRSMLSRALKRVVLGLAIGIAASLVLTRAVQALLYGIAPTDLPSHAVAIAIVLVTALGATLIPALQAARVDPARVLRSE